MGHAQKKGGFPRDPQGHFAPTTSVRRFTRRYDVSYFLEARRRVTPERFGAVLSSLLAIALNREEDTGDRIAAAAVLQKMFLPKDWQALELAAREDEEQATQAREARTTPCLLQAVEELVIKARDQRRA